MAAFFLLSMLSTAAASGAGPDAARIIELYNAAGLRPFCVRAVICPRDLRVIRNVRCTREPGGARLARCSFTQRGGRFWPNNCSGVFQADSSGRWFFRPRPKRGPESPGLPFEVPLCSVIGAPDATQIAAIRAVAWPQIECQLSPAQGACPGPAARVEVINCRFEETDRRAFCIYTLREDARFYFCQTYFSGQRGRWRLESYRSRDGLPAHAEPCQAYVAE